MISTESQVTEPQVQRLQELWRDLEALEAAYTSNKVCFYKPISKQAERFHCDDDAAIRLILGSNRSSKSTSGCMEFIAHAFGYRPWLPEDHPNRIVRLCDGNPIPVPNVGRILAQDYQQAIQQTIVPKIEEWAPKGSFTFKRDNRGIPTRVNWKNGSITYLLSNDQKDMSFEGTDGHYVWFDEPPDNSKYVGLRRGLIDHSGHCWLTMTPISQPWIHDVIYSRANEADEKGNVPVRFYRFSIWDNCKENGGYLRREDIEEFLSDLDEAELEARLHGNFIHLAGRVYKDWEPEPPYWIEPFNIPESWPRICVIDPHPRKPVAVLWAAIDPDNRIIIYRDLFDNKLRTITEVADRIKELEGWKWNDLKGKWLRSTEAEFIAARLIDDSSQGQERTSGDSIFRRFTKEGIYCALANKRNADAGYDAIRSALIMRNEWSQPGLVVFNCCRHVKHNFLTFVWDEWATSKQRDLKGPKQEPRKINDDFIDNIRYIYQSGLNNYRLLRRKEKQASYDHNEDYNGRCMVPGTQGPMTRRERQEYNRGRCYQS